MEYRPGKETDFINVETFVWQAIFPAFDHPDLTDEQRAENDAIVSESKSLCLEAVALENKQVFVAYDAAQRRMAGFIILDKSPLSYPEVVWLIVSRKYWGKGIADGLMHQGVEWLGTNKPITMAVHYFLERAIAFFARYGFENTGEPAGDHLIPRLLLLREAGPLPVADAPDPEQLELAVESPDPETVHHPLKPDLFSTQPPPEVVADASPTLFAEEEEEEEEEEESPAITPDIEAEPTYRSKFTDIEFEIDYGEPEEPATSDAATEEETDTTVASTKIDFEFAFDAAPEPTDEVIEEIPQWSTDEPVETIDIPEALELPNLEAEIEVEVEEEKPTASTESETVSEKEPPPVDLSALRMRFQDYFMQTVTDLFGNKAAVKYLETLRTSDFNGIVDRSLKQLAKNPAWESRFEQLAGDLVEYFIVETAADLHQNTFPQRLLRYQSKQTSPAEYFSMINSYLDLASENERVDTDFITIAPKRLKNATKNFLLAGPGERIFYLVDQSILGNLKNGFAFTDQAFYWKALLQPNHVAYYREIKEIKLEKGNVSINGHFFDTGKRSFNLKIALLLKKLARLSELKE